MKIIFSYFNQLIMIVYYRHFKNVIVTIMQHGKSYKNFKLDFQEKNLNLDWDLNHGSLAWRS